MNSSTEREIVSGVYVSHPERVIFNEQGITKLDLVRYYEKISEWILPYVYNRPLSTVRCPEGDAGICFFQKHPLNSMPDYIKTFNMVHKEKSGTYIYIEDQRSLLTLIQFGIIEFHVMGCRVDLIEKPDVMVFDLDPSPEIKVQDIVHTAKALRDVLNELGLISFVKTSGGKGLHIVVPVERTLSWDVFKEFSGNIAKCLVKEWPSFLTATMSKAERKGKIFIDYFRNGKGMTWISPYSVRARKTASISTPLYWEELKDNMKFDGFTMRNINRKLKESENPWKRFFAVKQRITPVMIESVKSVILNQK